MTTALTNVDARAMTSAGNEFGENLVARFVKFAGVSENSAVTYSKSLRQMFKYFAANNISAPTRENLIDWVDEMKAAGKSSSTIQLYTASAKVFFRWLSQEGIFANIADHLKTGIKPSHTHKKDALAPEQCKALVDNVAGNSIKNLRDKAILSLMVTAGLRTIEVIRADVGDVRFERGKIFLFVQGKGHADKDERVLLSKQTYNAIRAYLSARGKTTADAPLFVSTSRRNKGERLQTQAISRLVKSNLRGIGLDSPRLTAHSLRHSTATNLVFAGVELPKVQQVLRHRSMQTTLIYADAWHRFANDSEQLLADVIFGKGA